MQPPEHVHYLDANLAGKRGKRREPTGRAHISLAGGASCRVKEPWGLGGRSRPGTCHEASRSRPGRGSGVGRVRRGPAGRSLRLRCCWLDVGLERVRGRLGRMGRPACHAGGRWTDDGCQVGGSHSPLNSGCCREPGRRRGSSVLYLAWSMSGASW